MATAGRLAAQSVIRGAVRDSLNRPIRGTVVAVAGGPRTAVDSFGRYELTGVAAGARVVSAHRMEFYRETARLTVRRRDTLHYDFVLTRSPPIGNPLSIWLGCAGAPAVVPCERGRHLSEQLAFRESGTWVIDDSVSWSAVWRAHDRSSPPVEPPPIQWATERIFVVSYGGFSGCGVAFYVNRLERNRDSTIVVLGPDSVRAAPGYDECSWYHEDDADIVVSRLGPGPVVFRPANLTQRVPPARTVPR